jgi:hypothetical protein
MQVERTFHLGHVQCMQPLPMAKKKKLTTEAALAEAALPLQ